MKLTLDEISPITGRCTVMVEEDPFIGDTVKMCMESGYQTYVGSWKVENEEVIANIENQFPECVVDSKYIDDNGNIWYRSFLISPNVILYPDREISDDGFLKFVWKVTTLTTFDPGAGRVFEVGNETKYLDEVNAMIFNENEFEDALYGFQQLITSTRNTDNEN